MQVTGDFITWVHAVFFDFLSRQQSQDFKAGALLEENDRGAVLRGTDKLGECDEKRWCR